VLLVGVCRWGFRLLAGDLYIYRHSVGVDGCISSVGFMLYGWVLLRFICALCDGVCVCLGGVNL
jgi:hypothetical protein